VSDLYRLAWRSRVRNIPADAPPDASVALRLPATRPRPPGPAGAGSRPRRRRRELPVTTGPQTALDVLAKVSPAAANLTRLLAGECQASDTGELVRDAGRGMLMIDTPRCQAVVGELAGASSGFQLSTLSARSATSYGALLWLSLDGEPLARARRTLLKMVSVARNTGQRLALSDEPRFAGRLALLDPGGPPILTDGRPDARPTVARAAGRDLAQVYMTDGVWELVRGPEGATLFCDTPGVDFILPGVQSARALTADGPGAVIPVRDGRLVYPAGAIALALSEEARGSRTE
jgi:hypothetical protein